MSRAAILPRAALLLVAAFASALALPLCPASAGAAPEPAQPPVVTGGGVFLRRPGGSPLEIGFDSEGRLDASVPPGSSLYFVIDNATIASHLTGYTAYLRCTVGDEYVEEPPTIRYIELFSGEGSSIGYRYAVQVSFAQGGYQEPPVVTGYLRVGVRSERQGEFKFTAVLQEEPLDAEVAEVICTPDVGEFVFAQELSYTRLIFGEWNGGEEYGEMFVWTSSQRPLDLTYTTLPDRRITSAFPGVEFTAISFPARPVFDNTGVMAIAAPEGYHLYEVTPLGLNSPSYSYSGETGRYLFSTRRLGSYIISPHALPEDLFSQFKQNPATGAVG